MTKAKLIVIDGSDGSGKATQTKLLIEALTAQNKQATSFSFPRYDQFYGLTIKQMQCAAFGNPAKLNPYLASLPYAFDRLQAKPLLQQALQQYDYVILDRYIPSNIAHQGGKIKNQTERLKFISWIEEMEYSVNGLPKEDSVIFLHVPYKISMELQEKMGKERDEVERNQQYLKNAEKTYLWCANHFPHWKKIECIQNNQLLSIQDIHTQILDFVSS